VEGNKERGVNLCVRDREREREKKRERERERKHDQGMSMRIGMKIELEREKDTKGGRERREYEREIDRDRERYDLSLMWSSTFTQDSFSGYPAMHGEVSVCCSQSILLRVCATRSLD